MTPLVADASALVEYLLGSALGAALASTIEDPMVDLHTPALCDVELVSALRGVLAAKQVTHVRALEAVSDYRNLPLTRHGHVELLDRVVELRHNFSAYDATYLALAEALGAGLMTCDTRFAKSVEAHVPGVKLVADKRVEA